MLIKPIVDKIKAGGFFHEVKVSKDLPSLDDIKQNKLPLPICYLLPVKDTGHVMSFDAKPRQGIEFLYSLCIVAKSGDEDCLVEPPMTFAKAALLEALLGFVITPDYSNLSFVEAQIRDKDHSVEMWTCGFQAQKNFKKNT
jgi:hypothetical protein